MPIFIPIIVGTAIRYTIGGVITYVVGKEIVAIVDEDADEKIEDIEQGILDAGADLITQGAEALGSGILTVVEGLGSAIIDGVDQTYNYARIKIIGREADAIAALTSTVLVLVTGIYIYQTVKKGGSPIL